MKSAKIVVILLFALGFGGAAFYFSDQQMEKVEDQEAGVFFLSGLMSQINNVSQVVITEKQVTTSLVLKDQHWVVKEKAGYAADFAKVKKLLLNLAEMETIESKTSKPENYSRLGVQNVGDPGEIGPKQIQLLDKAGNVMHTLIVGKSKSSKVPGGKSSLYVRQKNEVQSWLVSGKIDIPQSQVDWLNKQIIDLPSSRIQSVKILHQDKSQLRISKSDKADKNYIVENLPLKAKLISDNVANSIVNVLQSLLFVDVQNRSLFKVDEKQISRVTFTTFDDLQIMAKLSEKNGKQFIWFDSKSLSSDENIVKESGVLNAKFALWVYEISSLKADEFKKQLEDLIITKNGKG